MITLGCVGDVSPGPNHRGPSPTKAECGMRSEPVSSAEFLGLWPLAPNAPSSDSAPLAYVTSTVDTKHQGHPALMAEAPLSAQGLSIYN